MNKAKDKPDFLIEKITGMRMFSDIFNSRKPDAGWNVVQAATLLSDAKQRRCSSLVIYAALELRLAIEQLIFTVIVVGKGGTRLDGKTIAECRKKDGLFRVLDDVSPKYSLRCRFSNTLASFYPELPQIAEWDVRSLRRYYTDLSEYCHSQLIIRDFDTDPNGWSKKISQLEDIYHFLASSMKKGTGVLELKNVDPVIEDLWEKFSTGSINIEELRNRFALVKPVWDSKRIIRP